MPYSLAQLGAHRYLCEGFALPGIAGDLLRGRYETAVQLMDRKLERFFEEAEHLGVLDDTLVVLTSDHGEAFGEHELYLHDASVFETHLHVPLWVWAPGRDVGVVDEVVSTRDLFHLNRGFALEGRYDETILDESTRRARSYAEADHFHYPHLRDALPQYRVDQRAVVTAAGKFVVRGSSGWKYDLQHDRFEQYPEKVTGPALRDAGLGAAVTKGLSGLS